MKKIGIILSFLLLLFLAVPVHAALLNTSKSGELMNNVNGLATNAEYNTDNTLDSTIGSVIQIAMSFLGSIFIILMIISGINWMRAQGNEDVVKKSKATIINLTIGLVIALAAYSLSSFISNIFVNLIANK